MTEHHLDPTKKHDFVLIFDVTDGNPNGDPDAGNLPRVDPETMHGLVTDVAIKRKVRDYVSLRQEGKTPNRIYVEHRGFLVDHKKRAYEAVGAKKGSDDKVEDARKWLLQNYFDIRMFGGVLVGKKGEGYNAGQVRGPVQITFARSADPIVPLDLSITRVALENSGEKPRENEDDKAATGTMGRKPLVPYGLYVAHGFFSASFAKQTGVTREDLALLWEALARMWDHDRSATRGMMACRGLHVFTHESPYGDAPAHALFDRVRISAERRPARAFADYSVKIESNDLPKGVHLTSLGW